MKKYKICYMDTTIEQEQYLRDEFGLVFKVGLPQIYTFIVLREEEATLYKLRFGKARIITEEESDVLV